MLASRSPLPWLHIAEEVAKEARREGFQRVALLGTKLMMESRLYPDKFTEYGIEYVIPNEEERQCINRLVFEELVYGRFTNAARSYVTGVVERLRKEGSDAAGLCCTELPLLLKAEDTSLPLLDSTRILAIAALRRAAHGAEA